MALVKRKQYKTYLKISLGGEGLLTNGASERLITRMCTHVYLQGRTRREVLIAHVTQMLTGLQACKHTHNTHEARNQQKLVQAIWTTIFLIC